MPCSHNMFVCSLFLLSFVLCTAGSDRITTHLRPLHPLFVSHSLSISLQTFWTLKPLFWNVVLFSGSVVLSPTRTPTQTNLPTLMSHHTCVYTHTHTHAARFPAYRTTENTHTLTHTHHLRLFLSLRGDTLVGSSRILPYPRFSSLSHPSLFAHPSSHTPSLSF